MFKDIKHLYLITILAVILQARDQVILVGVLLKHTMQEGLQLTRLDQQHNQLTPALEERMGSGRQRPNC